MPNFNQRISTELNGLEVRVYDIDSADSEQSKKLEDFIIAKIQKMKIHTGISQYSNVEGISPAFLAKIRELEQGKIQEIGNPSRSQQSWFDVRRSRVTEFMSQLLLEKQMNCVFFDETDKRINLSAIEADFHVKGIDVTGIQQNGDNDTKFVVCEVKASKSDDIPCSTSNDLLNDIKKAYDFKNQRVIREIKDFAATLMNVPQNTEISGVLEFLMKLYMDILNETDSKEIILENVLFVPFLIRKNPKIIENQDINDFKNFNQEELNGMSVKGLIWVLNEDIDKFCINLYDKAVANEQ